MSLYVTAGDIQYRTIWYIQKNPNAIALAVTDVLEDDTFLSQYNSDNLGDFKVLRDTVRIASDSDIRTQYFHSRFNLALNRTQLYTNANDFEKNQIGFMIIFDTDSDTVVNFDLRLNTRLFYKDA
jgi:hypothetical protein